MAEEFLTGCSADLVTEFVKLISGKIKQQVLYVFKHNSYVNDLNDQVEELNHKRDRVEVDVEHARRQGDEIHKDVGKWLEDVKRFVEQEASPITRNEVQAGTCSLITRYKVGRRAVKAAKAGADLLGKNFTGVSYRPPPERTKSMYVDRHYEAFDSRESILSQIMETLKDVNVSRIGVWGMGGVGKTTLVKKVAWQAKEDNLFDDVVMVEVTEKPDHKRIQEKVAYDLGLQLGQHESEFQRAGRIRSRIKKGKRVLVILDNIWAKPDLDATGIPWGNDHEKETTAGDQEDCEGINDNQRLYKILVTSRMLGVLCDDMDTSKNFCVPTLVVEEARNLFWKIVGNSKKKTGLGDVAEEIVEKCGGLQLAVATIANALKNKNLYVWEDALGKLKTSDPGGIPEMNKSVFSIIKLSFDLLDTDEAKSLLLLFSLADTGSVISHDYLLRFGMGLGLFQDVYTLEKGRNRVDTLINLLKASCLLLEDNNKTFVKVHEVVHAVVVSIASTKQHMFNIQDVSNLNKLLLEKISKNPTAISLPYRDICELPERLECPKLELFFLLMKSHSLTIPNNFFEGLKELKVINLRHVNLLSVPLSLGYLTNLRTLCLNYCLLGDISIIGKLTNLEILSFSHSNIEQLPKEIGQLTQLQLLDLSKCSSLKVIPPNVISRLSRLEELDLEDSFVQWEDGLQNQDGCYANLAELNQLSLLTTLSMCILNAQIIPLDLFIQQLKRFRILIGDVWNWSHRIEASKILKLKLNNINYLGYKLIKRLLKITEDLFLDELNGVQNILYELDEEGFPNLKYLHVQNGPELLYFVNSIENFSHDAFPMLEELSLNNLINLVKICHSSLTKASFNKLKIVKVNKCDGLKHLFSISMAKNLLQLQEIEVANCEKLQVIFAEIDDEGHLPNESQTNSKIEFTQLRSLTLQVLSQFTSFSFNMKTPLLSQAEVIVKDHPEDSKTLFGKRLEFPSLEKLILSSINIEKIFSVGTSCHTLRSLIVEGCNGLKFLFSSSMVKSLMQLRYLKIYKCESMEEVIDTKGFEGEAMFIFPNLLDLWLEDLPKLTRFGIGTSVEFPLLNNIWIIYCPHLRTFFSNSTCNPDKINTQQSIQPLFGEKVGLPSLESLYVYEVDNLRKIWDDQLCSDSFCKLHVLILRGCNRLLNIFPSSMLGRLRALDALRVGSCDSLEEIFEFQAISGQKTHAITQLRILHLYNLQKLKHVWNMNGPEILAPKNLIKIRICACPVLKSLFPASIAEGLLKLEILEILDCWMNEIVAKEEREVEEETIPRRFRFPRLSCLELSSMKSLETFYPERHISEWPALKKIKVCDCWTINILFSDLQSHQLGESQLDHLLAFFLIDKGAFPNLEELEVSDGLDLLHLWAGNSQPSRVFQNLENLKVSECHQLQTLVPSTVSFPNLLTLEVSNCYGLINLVTLSTARSMRKITRINIVDCKMIEEIIAHKGDEAINDDDQIVFNKLNYLRLDALQSLTCFCSENYAIELPELEKVIIEKCAKMVTFSLGVLTTPKLHKVHWIEEDDDQWRWQGNLNTTTQLLFKELVGFRGIEFLKLSEFPQLKEIWQDQLPFSVFCNLRSLEVDECAHLSIAISTILLLSLNNLRDLNVRNCESLEEIFDLEKLNEDEHRGVLSQLTAFHLINLPRLKYICRSHQIILGFQNLKVLKVQNCSNLRYIFTLPMIAGLKHLQQMEISNCVTMEIIIIEEAEKDAANEIVLPMLNSIVLKSLPELTNFYSGSNTVKCPSMETITITNCRKIETFVFTNMHDLCIAAASPFFSNKVVFPALKKLELFSVTTEKIGHNQLLATSCFQNLTNLIIDGCDNMKYLFPSSVFKSLVQLQLLNICNCRSMEVVLMEEENKNETDDKVELTKLRFLTLQSLPQFTSFSVNANTRLISQTEIIAEDDSENSKTLFSKNVSLPNLDKLIVRKMDNLRKIWDNEQLHLDSFGKLWDLRVGDCSQLLHIFPSIVHGRLQRPEDLNVLNCGSPEEVFELQTLGGQETNTTIEVEAVPVDKVAFPRLKLLELSKLPKLLHLWKENSQLGEVFQNLTTVKVSECHKLMNMVPSSVSLYNLRTLEVSNCAGLISLVTSSTAKSLVQLRKMNISNCQIIEQIITVTDSETEVKDEIVFKELRYLGLVCLPRLRRFCLGNCTLEFPSLDQVNVSNCLKMETFSQGITSTPKLQGLQPTEEEDKGYCEGEDKGRWEGNLNTTIHHMFKEMNGHTSEEDGGLLFCRVADLV